MASTSGWLGTTLGGRAGAAGIGLSRGRALELLALASRAFLWALLRVLPAQEHAVVHGWPDSESNAVEMVRALRRRYTGRVYWLLDDVDYLGPWSAASELADSERVVRVRKRSVRGLFLSLTAEVTFFTHGLYTAVSAPRDRLVVNLWHGDGPKRSRDTELVRSSVVVSGSQLWGRIKGGMFDVPDTGVAVVGNPRVDQFTEALPAEALRRLGLRPGACRVLWLPTYREAKGPRARGWSDGRQLTSSREVEEIAAALSRAAERLGIELLIKPHPLDVDSYGDLGVRVLRGRDLDKAGVSLYQLIGRCDALVSDISSVWVDYLVLDRPVGFYIPDLAEIEARNGLNVPDLRALLPGPRITTEDDAARFLGGVAGGGSDIRPSSFPGFARIGVPRWSGPVADRLLDWLADFQRARGGRAMFPPELAGNGHRYSHSDGEDPAR